ncbi:MAG TPA: FKBP-type peptidyl-prolyl cis-trans isomerase, partial [Gammaproteobacteria bacterium]|nr:FKBP-type peptidyl-prolyl cis-trans isomerase [Gammaproteobacteria bacterium]
LAVLVIALATPAISMAVELKSHKQKFSYAVGYRLALSLMNEGLDVEPAAFSAAMKDALSGAKAAMTTKEMQASMMAERDKQLKVLKDKIAANKKAGDKYRAENAKKSGVKSLENGIQYKVIKSGKGKQATKNSEVTVNYKGKLINGTEFDSSYKRKKPATFGLSGVIKGWQEVVPLMKVGDKWEVVVPPEFAYADKGAGSAIGPGETLVFEIELLNVK